MRIRLGWVLFLLTAASYVFYPVWRLPLPWPAQWALLNVFVILAAAILYSPLKDVSLRAELPELRELWPAVLAAALVYLPFWFTPIAAAYDEQSHAGPAAWLLGRTASAIGLDIRFLPLLGVSAALLLAYAVWRLSRAGYKPPSPAVATLALAAAGNLYFLADRRFGMAGAIGQYATVLRYPPLSKFLYLAAYTLMGITEAAPRFVQFAFIALTAVIMLRLMKAMKTARPGRLAFLLIVIFPTFFALGITAELEAGTVFFFTAATYHFIMGVEGEDRAQFLKCAFWCAAGIFYKQLLLGLIFSLVPPLLILALLREERREHYLFGLKALALPLLIGLPFITLSDIMHVRDTALALQNVLKPQLMTLDLKVLYMTCGAPLTALLAVSAVYSLFRYRGLPLWTLLYVSAAYYLMISATLAVGYVRHAQPFYIALVFMTALAVSDLAARLRGLPGKALSAAVLGLFLYQSVLAKAPYQRKTAFNYYSEVFPYWLADAALKPGQKVYAPMEIEPSHFYLAKAGLAGKVAWDRVLPEGFDAARAEAAAKADGADFVLLPYSPFPSLKVDFVRIADALTASGRFRTERVFDYHGNKMILLKTTF